MNTDDRNESLEALLRDALTDEAEGVLPAGDGLSRIQQRIGARQSRLRWLRPTVAVGSAATVAAITFGAYVALSDTNNDKVQIGPNVGSETPSTSAPAVPTTNTEFPELAIFPFTSAAAEQQWETDLADGGSNWQTQPVDVATRWVADFLDAPSVDRVLSQTPVDGGDAVDVTLGRVIEGENPNAVPVTKVHLVQFGKAWIVTDASDPMGYLTVSTPEPGAAISSPVDVTGPAFGVDEGLKVEVRDATSSTSYGDANTSFGGGSGNWSVSVHFQDPTGIVGALVATDISNADGGPSRIVVERVTFAQSDLPPYPSYFYAVKNGRITEFAANTGDSLRYLTAEEPGGGPSDLQLADTDVYYLQGGGTCTNALMTVPTTSKGNGTGTVVVSPDTGYVITAYAVSEKSISTFEQACDPARSPAAKLVTSQRGRGVRHNVMDFPSLPPTLETDPSFEVPGTVQYLDAIVRTGNNASLARYDVYGDNDPRLFQNACSGFDVNDGMPVAIETDGTGRMWFAVQTGSSMQVVQCDAGGGKPSVAFTIKGQDQPQDLDVASDGSAVLLTDADGKVWRWAGSGKPVELSPSLPLTNVAW